MAALATIERAIADAAATDRLGYAFHAGYRAAIFALDPSLPSDAIGALCATEATGAHPRAIQTTLADGRLNGVKQFVSGGSKATHLFVVAKVGEREDGRPELKVARVPADTPGVQVEDLPELPFIPEVPHGTVTFTGAQVEHTLEGDGYARYLKPFRTIEDIHVFAAVVSCLLGNGGALPLPRKERFLAHLAALRDLSARDPSDTRTHRALAGVLSMARETIESMELTAFVPEFRERLHRDLPLLKVAEKVREQRRLTAWAERD